MKQSELLDLIRKPAPDPASDDKALEPRRGMSRTHEAIP